jgi:hemerythrin-like domain-containing protein
VYGAGKYCLVVEVIMGCIFKIDAKGVKDIVDIIQKYVDKYHMKIDDPTMTLTKIDYALKRMYNVK